MFLINSSLLLDIVYVDSLSTNPWFWLIYFSVAGSMAYWNYRRGHSFMIGLFIAVICTPIAALLFILFGKPNTVELKKRGVQQATASGELVHCPSCNGLIPSSAVRCKHCGKKLER